MRKRPAVLALALAAGALMLWEPAPVHASQIQFREGWWRTEFTVIGGSYSGRRSRTNDWFVMGTAEYEFPALNRATIGLQIHPLFYYDEHKNEDYSAGGKVGIGVGVVGRIYQHAETRTGWYLEAGISPLLHSGRLEGNSSNFNFLSDIGIGYRFPNGNWNVAAKWAHISNGGIGSRNAGTNGIGVAVGYRF